MGRSQQHKVAGIIRARKGAAGAPEPGPGNGAPSLAGTTLTVANWLPPSHPLVSEVIVPMTQKIAEATHGEVTATILPAPLGPPGAHFDFAVNGVAT